MQRIKKDDRVAVISGKDRGKDGRVIRVFPREDKILVEGINYVRKHQRMRQTRAGAQEGGIIETEAPLHISNVQPICPSCEEPVRVGYRLADPDDRRSKVRVCKQCDATF